MRILFLGTPEFAVGILKQLLSNKCNVVAVVTAADQPAGRGLKLQQSAVKQFAIENNLKVLQPVKLRDEFFLDEVRSLHIDLQIVVAFRMMPQILWAMPPLGTFNLHASLLPQYRGAAPINWAIINGEKQTGVTTFFLQQQIDAGNIILQQTVQIDDADTAGILHDKLMEAGGALVIKTVETIANGTVKTINQNELSIEPLHDAPKLFKQHLLINFNKPVTAVYNHIRGLSPYPAAFFEFTTHDQKLYSMKVYGCSYETATVNFDGIIYTDNKTYLNIYCLGGILRLTNIQLAGKKRMDTTEFLRGFNMSNCKLIYR